MSFENMTKERLLYVDYVKALAMILVIMGHVNFANQDIKAWIYSFHMPVFFFCTGLVIRSDNKTVDLKALFWNKFNRLMIPYFLWALLYAKFSIPNSLKIIYGSYSSIASSGALTSLWFLPVMFLALIFFYLSVKIGLTKSLLNKILLMAFAFSLGCVLPTYRIGYPWAFNVAFMAFVFLLLGNMMRGMIDKIYRYNNSHGLLGGTFLLVMFFLMFVGTLSYSLNNPHGGYVLMGKSYYGNYGLFAFTAVCGTMMLVSLCMMVEFINKRGFKWLSYIGQNTLLIFMVQKPIISCFKSFFQNIQTYDAVALLITTIGTLFFSCVLCIAINKYLPVLAGNHTVSNKRLIP